ncbi:Hypothetical protein HVR_LOCUS832 [uncultured virus]|nr:Hypothetical protein HVR_LOCUS832 [uncultured virus]
MPKFFPPQIAGNWLITNNISVEQLTPGSPVKFNSDIDVTQRIRITQKGELVTVKYLEATTWRPTVGSRCGVWEPTFRDGGVVSWKLFLSDYDDESYAYLQVYKVSDCGEVRKLWYNAVESGFNSDNPIQHPYASRAIWIKEERKEERKSENQYCPRC